MSEEMRKGHLVPLLLTSHGHASEKQSFYSLLDNHYKTTRLPVLEGKCILGSAYGWLVLADHRTTDDCCLWNPESKETIQLPRLHESWLYYNCCVLSKPPTDPDCLVVFKSYCNFKQSVCRIGDDEFVKVSFEEGIYRPLVAISSFQGQIYGVVKLGAFYELVTIRLVGKTVEFEPLLMNGERRWEVPELRRSCVTSHNNYLIESPRGGGEFFLVIEMISGSIRGGGVEFRVFRVDVKGLVCVELEKLHGQTIFIGTYGNGFCCPSVGMGIKPNSIYYTSYSTGRVLCVYDLDDRSTTMSLPCPVAGRYVSFNYWVDGDILGLI